MTSLSKEELELRGNARADTSLFGRLRGYFERRRAYATLMAMDDRLLDDLGLQRSTLKAAVFAEKEERRPSFLARLWQGLKKARQRRETIQALNALPDRLLADIGIERGLIGQFVAVQLGEDEWPHEPAQHRRNLAALAGAAVRPLRQWNLSRHAAGQMARIDAKLLDDIGYVKGDVDWVPEVLAKRQLDAANRNDKSFAA